MSSGAPGREALLAELNAAMREISGQGVLYSQAVTALLGINSTDLECLGPIASRGLITAGALAEATGLTTGAITGVIDRLERAGFAQRELDPSDRRKVLVRVLPSVAQRVVPLFKPMERAMDTALAAYSDDDLTLILDFLTRAQKASLVAMSELAAPTSAKPKLSSTNPIKRSRRQPSA